MLFLETLDQLESFMGKGGYPRLDRDQDRQDDSEDEKKAERGGKNQVQGRVELPEGRATGTVGNGEN